MCLTSDQAHVALLHHVVKQGGRVTGELINTDFLSGKLVLSQWPSQPSCSVARKLATVHVELNKTAVLVMYVNVCRAVK